jgi:hypothetical protein
VHLCKNLEHFLGAKENLLAIVGVIGAVVASLIGALVGGWMASRSALRAQKQAAEDQRQRDKETEQRAVNGTLQAIAAELKVFKAHALDPLDEKLKDLTKARQIAENREGTKPEPFALSPIETNHFIIFDSSAAMLGRINDEQLRRETINVYNRIKDLIDRLNATFPEYQIWRNASPFGGSEKGASADMLRGFEDGIRKSLMNLQQELGDLLPKIEKYLDP